MAENKNKPVKIPKKLNKFRRFSEFMEREHDLLLTNSEIQEIIEEAKIFINDKND